MEDPLYRRAAYWLVGLGLLGALLVAIAGYLGGDLRSVM
jgi:hypothetical protein